MPFQITKFGAVTLPVYEGSDDLAAAPARQALFDLPGGGVYDGYGSEQAPGGRLTLRVRRQIIGSSAADFRTQANTLRGLIGKRDQLWREWDDGTLEWVYARLVELQGERTPGHVLDQEFELLFAVESVAWNAETQTTSNTDLTGTPQNISLTNSGNAAIKNAIITVTMPATLAVAGGITGLTFTISGSAQFSYSGSLAANDVLVIDTGARSVTLNGADDYGNFSLTASHAISEWLRLAAGANTLTVTVLPSADVLADDIEVGAFTGLIGPPTYSTSRNSANKITLDVDYYDQWR